MQKGESLQEGALMKDVLKVSLNYLVTVLSQFFS